MNCILLLTPGFYAAWQEGWCADDPLTTSVLKMMTAEVRQLCAGPDQDLCTVKTLAEQLSQWGIPVRIVDEREPLA